MRIAETSTVPPEYSLQKLGSESLSLDTLIQRLSAEVEAANQRVCSLRDEAAKAFKEREQLFLPFKGVVNHIYSILLPRLHAVIKLEPFTDVTISERIDLDGPLMRCSHSRTTTLTIPASESRPVSMKIVFTLGPDGPVQDAILDYRLELLPIFIKFDSHDQLVIPVEKPDDTALAEWIDDKLVGFTRTYFDVFFNHEYQERCLKTDPVMRVVFPIAFAEGNKEHLGETYYFYAAESQRAFEQDPNPYVNGKATS